MVKVNSSVIKVKCLISGIVICIGESVIHRLKLNVVTALLLYYFYLTNLYILSS